MSGCEWCWARAGSVAAARQVDRVEAYREVMAEQEQLGALARCPEVAAAHPADPAPA